MITKMKIGIRLIPYATAYKRNLLGAILFMGMGIVVSIISPQMFQAGIIWIFAAGLFVIQMIYSVVASELVQSTSYKKKLQTSIPIMINFVYQFVLYTLLVGIYVVKKEIMGDGWSEWTAGFLFTGLLAAALTLYVVLAMWYRWISLFVFVGVLVFMNSAAWNVVMKEIPFPVSASVNITVGYAAIIVGSLSGYGVSCLLYRKGFSKAVMNYWTEK